VICFYLARRWRKRAPTALPNWFAAGRTVFQFSEYAIRPSIVLERAVAGMRPSRLDTMI